MANLGWGDPSDDRISISFRRKGRVIKEEYFFGPVYLLKEDRSLLYINRGELQLAQDKNEFSLGILDLSRVPVVTVGGKRKSQPIRALGFLEENPGFAGALILWPGSGNYDLGPGMIILTSRAVLEGKRISGGRPEVKLTGHHWESDGRYVAKRARMLHGKVLETLVEGIEQVPGIDLIVEAIKQDRFYHSLCDQYRETFKILSDLESKRVLLSGEERRKIRPLLDGHLSLKLKEAGVQKVSDIPETLTIIPEDIDPSMVAQASTLGTVEVPGLGRRLPHRERFGSREYLLINLKSAEVNLVTNWPFADISPWLEDWGRQQNYQFDSILKLIEEAPPTDSRWKEIKNLLSEEWLRQLRERNFPKDSKVTHPREADLPKSPDPILWGTDLLTGEEKWAYPALCHIVARGRGRTTDKGYFACWFDSAEEAFSAEEKAREDALTHNYTRHLLSKLAGKVAELQETGEVLVDWGGRFRRRGASGNGDCWVIQPDGLTRGATKISYYKDSPYEGDKEWGLIGQEELAISWSDNRNLFEVVKAPTEGCTKAQLDAVKRIESEIGAPRNAFGLR